MESDKLKELCEKCYTATKKLKKAYNECSPKHRKSEFVTCHECGSRYPRKYIYECKDDFSACIICRDRRSLYSATSIKRIKNCQNKLEESLKLLKAERERLEQSDNPNWSKFERSLNQVRNSVAGIYEQDGFDDYNTYTEKDFGNEVEIYGTINTKLGDISVHYEVMKEDGAVYRGGWKVPPYFFVK